MALFGINKQLLLELQSICTLFCVQVVFVTLSVTRFSDLLLILLLLIVMLLLCSLYDVHRENTHRKFYLSTYFSLRSVEKILKKFDTNIPHWKPFQAFTL